MSIHENHRKRLKQRFLRAGLENFDDLYILELLLFYCVPRKDTNLLAHKLLERFGTLPNVLDASVEELKKVDGVGDGIVTFFLLLRDTERVCQIRRNAQIAIVNSHEDIKKHMLAQMNNQRNETVYMMCLDAKRKILSIEKVGEGSVNSANVPIRRIVELALASNATTVILGHNHPGGLAFPSQEDINTTIYVAKALRAVEVYLADHVIVADGEYVSLAQSGVYRPGIDGVLGE